jgi:hypothetical protein
MTTTIGPTVMRECGFCDGSGYRIDTSEESEPVIVCTLCHGRGSITVRVHPFVDLGRAVEHVQAIRTCMRLRRTRDHKPKIGTPAYHVDAAEDALGTLFQQLVVMLPEEWQRTESGES